MKNILLFLGVNLLAFIIVMIGESTDNDAPSVITRVLSLILTLAFLLLFFYTSIKFIISPFWLWFLGKPQPTHLVPPALEAFFRGKTIYGRSFWVVLIFIMGVLMFRQCSSDKGIQSAITVQYKPFMLLGIPVDGDVDLFVKKLKAKEGITYKGSIQGEYLFHHKLTAENFNYMTVIYDVNTNEIKTIELDSEFIYNWARLHERYIAYKDVFTGKYGKSDYKEERFNNPYKYGDGDEIEAIREGKCTYKSMWELEQGTLQVLIMNHCLVSVVYTKNI